jgi:hypothetical protein
MPSAEEQHIVGMVGVEVIQNGIDPRHLWTEVLLHLL